MNERTLRMLTFLCFVVLLGAILFAFIQATWQTPDEDKVLPTDCYDKYSHKINDVTCTKVEPGLSIQQKYNQTILILLLGIFGLLVIAWSVLGWGNDS